MIDDRIVLVVGLFVVPLALVWFGHHLRRRSRIARAAFWGGVYGYGLGVLIISVLTVVPPVNWAGGGVVREFAVHYSMLVLTLLGLALGVVWGRWKPRAHTGLEPSKTKTRLPTAGTPAARMGKGKTTRH